MPRLNIPAPNRFPMLQQWFWSQPETGSISYLTRLVIGLQSSPEVEHHGVFQNWVFTWD
jgi:hypothetical protein